MKKEFSHYDILRWEVFEKLFPQMLYDGGDEACTRFFNSVCEDGQELAYFIYKSLCSNDKVECPYKSEDFKTECLSRGNINMVKIQLPEHNPDISDILRVYVVYSGKTDDPSARLYFIVRRFVEGQVVVMYVSRQLETLRIEEITDHAGDMEYEYWRIAVSYTKIVCDMMAERELKERNWSRDWSTFDWEPVREKLRSGKQDIGITRDEFIEFMDWYALSSPKDYDRSAMFILLSELGVPDEKAQYLSEHLEEFQALLTKFESEEKGSE